MTHASAGIVRLEPTSSINPSLTRTVARANSPPLTVTTFASRIATAEGGSAPGSEEATTASNRLAPSAPQGRRPNSLFMLSLESQHMEVS